jgi:hypothetical protein
MFWGGIEPSHYDFQSYALPFKLPKLILNTPHGRRQRA